MLRTLQVYETTGKGSRVRREKKRREALQHSGGHQKTPERAWPTGYSTVDFFTCTFILFISYILCQESATVSLLLFLVLSFALSSGRSLSVFFVLLVFLTLSKLDLGVSAVLQDRLPRSRAGCSPSMQGRARDMYSVYTVRGAVVFAVYVV